MATIENFPPDVIDVRQLSEKTGFLGAYNSMRNLSGLSGASMIISPYIEVFTLRFLEGLIGIGELEIEKDGDIILVACSDTCPKRIETLRENGVEVLCDLSEMEHVLPLQVRDESAGKTYMLPSWTGDVPHYEEYVVRLAQQHVHELLLDEWDGGIFFDGWGVCSNPGNADNADMLVAMALGLLDMDDVRDLMCAGTSSELDVYSNLNLARKAPEWIVRARKKAEDVLALWKYLLGSVGLHIVFCADEFVDKDGEKKFAKRFREIGEVVHMDILLDAYAHGVPVEDITA